MKIKKLNNPKTPNYCHLKELLLGENIPWYVKEAHPNDLQNNFKFFSHCFLERPSYSKEIYPRAISKHTSLMGEVLKEIFQSNVINPSCVYRMNANFLPPVMSVKRTKVHVDHDFPHQNIIIYLTDSGGRTIVGNESHDPEEDDIVMFGGHHHCVETPVGKWRLSLVATFGVKEREVPGFGGAGLL
jgi:hypothetical protein|tara:strand:- start:3 stop:560 length:558 start_codon:yes stop_codon:yes gene_type:complete